ncbi:MAG: PIG-L family deacetylase, partial [Acidobacteria bacterium]|nr:PIG-L family deacetylase [Acidobacteriota bacterium]
MKANVLNRRVHYWIAVCALMPLAIMITSGLLLQMKKQWSWVQPPEQRGTGLVPVVDLEALLTASASVPGMNVTSWGDVNRIDVRPDRGVAKVWLNSGYEVQVDLGNGEVLQTAYRRSDLIESIHDGSFFGGEVTKLGVFLPAGLVMLLLWGTGAWMAWIPIRNRRRVRKARQTVYADEMRRVLLLCLSLSLLAASTPLAQHRLQPISSQRGEPALELMLRKLDTVGNFMMTTAHPDDENNAMLAFYAHGNGFRTSLVSATRGEGGQNEIGPELFEALAVLRTEELLAAHRFDGAEQYFTRAVDFGYSFSVDETFEQWGKQEILSDYVRMIRTIRPDVIVGFVFDGAGGGQHHQASSRLTAEAYREAANPAAFPEQIQKEGLRPWQAKKFYYTAGFGGGAPAESAAGASNAVLAFTGGEAYDPILGRTYAEIAGEARSMHKCQGMSQLLPLPASTEQRGFGGPRSYRLHDTVLPGGVGREESEPFDGVDTTLRGLVSYAGPQPPTALTALV